jgi:hypothetical protein
MKRKISVLPPVGEVVSFDVVDFGRSDVYVGDDVIEPVSVVEPQSGRELPVAIIDRREDGEDGPDVWLLGAWSAGTKVDYQIVRAAAYAVGIEARIIAPNTVGQGVDSPRLTRAERAELRVGRARRVGAFMVDAAMSELDAIVANSPEVEPAHETHLVAVSQGPVLLPGVAARLLEQMVDISSITIATPGSTHDGGVFSLFKSMISGAGAFMKEYRDQNPGILKGLKDTNILRSILTQFRAHIIDYPLAMTNQHLAAQLAEVFESRDKKPRISIIAASEDNVSPLAQNIKLAADLSDAGFEVDFNELRGQYHAVTEHVPLMTRLFRKAIYGK